MKIKMKLELSTPDLIIKIVLMSILFGFIGLILAGGLIQIGFDFLLDFYYLIAFLIIFITTLKKIINAITLETNDSIKIIDNSKPVSIFQKEFEKERQERQ